MSNGRLIILCGLPGAGKTTLAKQLELRYLSAPPEVLYERVQRRGLESPPIQWEDLLRWAELIELPDDEEMALYDPPENEG